MKRQIFNKIKHILSRNFREFLILRIRYDYVARYCSKEIKFLNYKFKVPDCLSFIFQYRDIFVEELYRFNSNKESPIIYDCGANIGTSCIYFKRLFPKAKIIAFEADPKISNVLKENLSNNGLSDVTIINKAVWNKTGYIRFGPDGADSGSIHSDKNTIVIESIRLKDFLLKETEIDFLKMDIEGAEIEVIQDCDEVLEKIKNLFIEFHYIKGYKGQLLNILRVLEKNGFKFYLQSIDKKISPFIFLNSDPDFKLQLNIFAYKNIRPV